MKKIALVCGVVLFLTSQVSQSGDFIPLKWQEYGDVDDGYHNLGSRAWYSRSRFQVDGYTKSIHLVALKNSSRVKDFFESFQIRRIKGKSPSGKRVKVSTIGEESCQCVSFVKAITGSTTIPTRDWYEGESLKNIKADDPKLRSLEVGVAIATFDSEGNYDHNHTAIIVEKSGKGDWITVIDQNWSPIIDKKFAKRENDADSSNNEWTNCELNGDKNKKGFVMKHRIYFDERSSYVSNAYNYSIIEVEK